MIDRAPTQMVGFQLRFQEKTRQSLEESAKANGRSLNAEIVRRLEASLLDDSFSALTDRVAFIEKFVGIDHGRGDVA